MKLTAILCTLFLLLSGCDKGEEEIVIVPKNYTGYIVILFNQKNGAEPDYENKKRVYRIPPNGILKTQFTGNYGWVGFTEFYYDKIDSQNQIPFRFDPKNIPNDTIVAYGGSTGNANKDLAGKETVEFRLFYIGNSSQIDTAYEKAEKLDIVKLAE